jgi:hypothetical protein
MLPGKKRIGQSETPLDASQMLANIVFLSPKAAPIGDKKKTLHFQKSYFQKSKIPPRKIVGGKMCAVWPTFAKSALTFAHVHVHGEGCSVFYVVKCC